MVKKAPRSKRSKPIARGMRRPQRVRRYADSHSFKLQSVDTSLYNADNGGVIVPTTKGSTYVGAPQLQTNNTLWFGGSFNFLAQNALQWNQLNTLFDRVKVNLIKVRVIPTMNVNTIDAQTIPVMRMVYDYDDNSVPSVGDIWSRRGIERRLNRPFNVFLKPKVLVNLFTAAAGGTAYAPKPTQYLNTGNAGGIPLLGLKYAIKDWPTGNNAISLVRFEITYYMTFREQLQVGKTLTSDDAQVPTALVEEDKACENKESPPEVPL